MYPVSTAPMYGPLSAGLAISETTLEAIAIIAFDLSATA